MIADAGIFRSIPYWYCRNCKIEVNQYGWEVTINKKKEIEDLFDDPELNPYSHDNFFWGF